MSEARRHPDEFDLMPTAAGVRRTIAKCESELLTDLSDEDRDLVEYDLAAARETLARLLKAVPR